jgi:hypothetical protein
MPYSRASISCCRQPAERQEQARSGRALRRNLLGRYLGRPGCALNRQTWSPVKGSSARVSPNRLSYGCPTTIFRDPRNRHRHHLSATLLDGRAGNGWTRLLRCGCDRSDGGFPNAGYEPHPSCGDCPLTARLRSKIAFSLIGRLATQHLHEKTSRTRGLDLAMIEGGDRRRDAAPRRYEPCWSLPRHW